MRRVLCLCVAFWLGLTPVLNAEDAGPGRPARPMVLVVMDPLAKPLSCPCVAGYAQRDYEKLAEAMSRSLGQEVKLVFNESLRGAKKKADLAAVDLVIGKQSVVLHDAAALGMNFAKVAMLTGKDGKTTQRGLIVVAASDSAQNVADLKDYRMFFGPQECEEKHHAAIQLLQEHGVKPPATIETAVACDEGAIKILKLAEEKTPACAVISSYAKPLLEGCGQVPKGSLRVVGETGEIPFIAAYVNADLDSAERDRIAAALVKSTGDIALRLALETKRGFVAEADAAKKK
ncbi:PhnD/SsuA/transferrin family substrate-binding protein [Planctomyces sp. SH-PL14]|uniref:PhnD/SsuA/transferrin family substrate-binding protein n=1 Tax=Planctomyces sp. SH-PL14 TaxID=1632864 RepID=UPI00078E39C6|nr:PhnD/SsuA/transferrin family substrate-binding protein [Planctomyces sp. SH-PL14]AMV22488.1 ABC transporter, phosphonate, periplasmic substrate-binding protein [Planctomyces sp. SH-PL14]